MTEPKPGVALVTGAGRGIGRAIALRLASDGYAVAVHCRSSIDEAQAVVTQIEQAGGRALCVCADLTQRDAAKRVVDQTAQCLDGLDVLVLSHGKAHSAPLLAQQLDSIQNTIDTNLVAGIQLMSLALPHMLRRRFGRLVAVSSIVASQGGMQGLAAYAASKAGLIAFVKTVANELSPRMDFTANAVSPGVVPTDMTSELIEHFGDTLRNSIPRGRFGLPEEIAAAVSYLVSPQAAFVNGHNLAVDGGQSLGYWNHRKGRKTC